MLTIVAVIVMTIGALLGSSLVSTRDLAQRSIEAQAAPTISPNQGNIDASSIEMSFGPVINRNDNQKMTAGNICFKSESGNPPNNGLYRVKAFMKVAGSSQEIEVGSSLQYKILTQRASFRCPNQKPYDLFIYRNLNNVPGLPAGTTLSDIEYVHIHVSDLGGEWNPSMSNEVAVINNPASLFDKTPGPLPTQAPTATPEPTATPGPTATPTITPTPSPTPQPGTGNVNITMKVNNPNDMKDGFDRVEFVGEICTIDASGRTEACGSIASLPTPDRFTVSKSNTAVSERTQTLNVPAETLRVFMNYDYKKDDDSIDNTGITITHGSTTCTNRIFDQLTTRCDVTINDGESSDIVFEVNLPSDNPAPTNTPAPGEPTNTPTPENQTSTLIKSWRVANYTRYTIIQLQATVCVNELDICDTVAEEVNVPSQSSGIWRIEFEFPVADIISHKTTKKCTTYEIPDEDNVRVCEEKTQSALGNEESIEYLSVREDGITSTSKTISEAADISGDACVNSNDAALLVQELGTEAGSLDACDPADILCDGFINALDLSILIENLNQGFGCLYNQPTE